MDWSLTLLLGSVGLGVLALCFIGDFIAGDWTFGSVRTFWIVPLIFAGAGFSFTLLFMLFGFK